MIELSAEKKRHLEKLKFRWASHRTVARFYFAWGCQVRQPAMEPYTPGRSRLFQGRFSASPSTTPTPTLTNGFSSPGSSPSNTVSRTIPTTIQINRPFQNNLNNGGSSVGVNNNPATSAAATNCSSAAPMMKRPTNTSLSSLGIGQGESSFSIIYPFGQAYNG